MTEDRISPATYPDAVERLAALQELPHRLRNKLGIAMAVADLLEVMETGLSDNVRAELDIMRRAIDDALAAVMLLSDILDPQGPETGANESSDRS